MHIPNWDNIPLTPSTLKVIASESVDIESDLENTNNKSIAELINEEKKNSEEKTEETD